MPIRGSAGVERSLRPHVPTAYTHGAFGLLASSSPFFTPFHLCENRTCTNTLPLSPTYVKSQTTDSMLPATGERHYPRVCALHPSWTYDRFMRLCTSIDAISNDRVSDRHSARSSTQNGEIPRCARSQFRIIDGTRRARTVYDISLEIVKRRYDNHGPYRCGFIIAHRAG